jgi:hypothetical protein
LSDKSFDAAPLLFSSVVLLIGGTAAVYVWGWGRPALLLVWAFFALICGGLLGILDVLERASPRR